MKRKTKNHPAADASLCGVRLFFGQFTAKIKLKKGQALRLPLSIELP